MIPLLDETGFYRVEEDRLLMTHKETGANEEICRLNERQRFIIHHFDGHHELYDIAWLMEDRFGEDREVAYQQAKSLFITLAKHMICYPVNAPDIP